MKIEFDSKETSIHLDRPDKIDTCSLSMFVNIIPFRHKLSIYFAAFSTCMAKCFKSNRFVFFLQINSYNVP